MVRVVDAIQIVNHGMCRILCPVIGIGIGQSVGIDAEKRIMGEEERATIGGTEW
jgi:hypothetical protein